MQPNQNPTCNVTENFPKKKKNYFKIWQSFSPKKWICERFGGGEEQFCQITKRRKIRGHMQKLKI